MDDSLQLNPAQLERICRSAQKVDDQAAQRPIDSLVYANPFEPGCFKLIEVPEVVASRVLKGERFYVSGQRDDQLVFCTSDQTFQTKEVERSNSMVITNLVVPPENVEEQTFRKIEVSSIVCRNFELTEAPLYKPPKFRQLLASREINLFDEEPEFPVDSLSLLQFMSSLPLCEEHVNRLLLDYPIFKINGSILCLSADGRDELMREFASSLDDQSSVTGTFRRSDLENSSIFSEINTRFSSTVVGSLVDWMLRSFFDSKDDVTFELDVDRLGREFCSLILRKRAWGAFMDLDELERHFYRVVPTSISFDLKLLRGVGFLKPKTSSGVKFLSSEILSLDSKERLEELWKLSETWTLKDVEPYVLDFVGDPKLVFEFLATRCRVNSVNGKPVFHRL